MPGVSKLSIVKELKPMPRSGEAFSLSPWERLGEGRPARLSRAVEQLAEAGGLCSYHGSHREMD